MANRSIFGLGLCAGALGLELGLEIALPGYRTIGMVERESAVTARVAARIQERSIPELAAWDDLTGFDGTQWRGIIHIVTAGFPCQPWSVAGKRAGTKDERWIWPQIARIIGEVQPDCVFLENVPGLLLDPDSDVDPWELEGESEDALGGMGTVLRDLAGLGFDAEWCCLRASDVGASHGRKRVFILAYREGFDGWGQFAEGSAGIGSPGSSGIRGTLADPSNRQFQEPGRGIRKGSDELEHTALAASARFQQQREHLSGATDRDLGNTGCGSAGRLQPERQRERSAETFTEDSESNLDDTIGRRHEGQDLHLRSTRPDETTAGIGRASAELPLFAPGPNSPDWPGLLVRFPWLRPSISQAEVESYLRDDLDGLARLLVNERTGALRALGNGVVALQAACAFVELVRRVTALSNPPA